MSSNGWRRSKLKDLCTKIGSGATPRGGKEAYLDEAPFALIRSQNVLDFFFSHDGLAFIDEIQAGQLSNVELQKNDVLLNITGDSVARVCQVPNDLLPARVNQHVAIIRPDEAKLIPEYLKYYLLNPAFKSYMLGMASVGATRNALTKGMIEDFEIDLPPLPTQRRIANILSALDDKIELNRQTNATLEAIAQAIFKEWFVDFNFPGATGEMEESALGLIPKGWQTRSLYDSATYINGAAYRDIDFSPDKSGLPVVKINELKYGITGQTNFTNKELNSKYKMNTGEMLFSWSGSPDTSLDIFVWAGGPAWLNQHIFRVLVHGKEQHHFVYYLLRHLKPVLIEIARDKQTTGLGHVTVQDMKRMQVLYPPDEVMENFGTKVAPIYELALNNSLETLNLTQLRNTLLPKLMTGEIEM